MENIFDFVVLLLFFSPGGTYETHCSSGERLYTPREGHDVCIPCQRRTFMEVSNHTFRQCEPCTTIENPDVEVVVSACKSTHDAVILCTGGFYRRRARNIMEEDRCEKCTDCPFPARPCEGYYDTVCCPPNHDAVMTPYGVFVCSERPILCGPGQFFRTSSEDCLPCPAGTFMSYHRHTYKDCLQCEEISENNLTQAVITRPCSSTAPTLFGCKAGYFRDPTQESLQIEVPCTPCRTCNRSLVDCGMFHDAVCDDEFLMVSAAPANLAESIGDEVTMKQLHGAIDAHKSNSQSDKHDCEFSSSTELLDTDYVWILQLIGVTLLICSILPLTLIIFRMKQCHVKPDDTYDNTFDHWHKIQRHVHTIRWFSIISLIVLCIFQSVVTVLNTKPRLAYALTAVYTLMTLSILIVMANAITFILCCYIIYRLRNICPGFFSIMHIEDVRDGSSNHVTYASYKSKRL